MSNKINNNKTARNILVTNALIYANGDVHLGHLLGHVQADVWVRFQRMNGHNCTFLCGSDTHGTPIMLKAQSLNISPEQLVNQVSQKQQQDLADYGIIYDNYHSTNHPLNQQLVEDLYYKIKNNKKLPNLFQAKTIQQLYDPIDKMFLPDRYVKGTCPKCKTDDQYSDGCEACGATYSASELINPKSVTSGTTPILKDSEHYFFDLPQLQDTVADWLKQADICQNVKNKLAEWFEQDLKQWDVSRDEPYFGFEFPDHPGKYFYVWLDAPVGYIAASKAYQQKNSLYDHDSFWSSEKSKQNNTELVHFIGKDIVYFHAIFWPALLASAQYRLPTLINVNGFVTIDGQKMSKSRGTFITAADFKQRFAPTYLRYYFAAKLTQETIDIDLNIDDFTQRVNTDLVNKYVNIASRCSGFLKKFFNNTLTSEQACQEFSNNNQNNNQNNSKFEDVLAGLKDAQHAGEKIGELYDQRAYSHAMREIMHIADHANQFIDHYKPWAMAKSEQNKADVQIICTIAINYFRLMSIYLKPVIPEVITKVEQFLKVSEFNWDDHQQLLFEHEVAVFQPLLARVIS